MRPAKAPSRTGLGTFAALSLALLGALPTCSLISLDELQDGVSCPAGKKPCLQQCVDVDDPLYGCGAMTCDPCQLDNASATCAQGACAIAICAKSFADCDHSLSNGCETNLDTNVSHCGACEIACPATSDDTAVVACQSGVCGLVCPKGRGNCNGNLVDGCETDLTTDSDCGACHAACAGGQSCDPTMGKCL